MSSQIEEDLKLIKHTLLKTNLEWENWCRSLPPLKDVEYSLIRKDGTVLCDSVQKNMEGKKLPEREEIPEADELNFVSSLKKSDLFGTQAVFGSMGLGGELLVRKVVPISSLRDNMDRFDRVLFLRIVPFAFASYLLFIFLFYRSTRPLGIILSKVEKFMDDIPFKKSLSLLYERDEWAAIEEALNKADRRLQLQVEESRLENEKNTTILESINDAIIAVDRYESILFFNSRFENSFMKKREGQEINKKVWHIFSDDVLHAFQTTLKTGGPQSLKRMNFPYSNYPDRFYDLTITPLKIENGMINGALGVFYDVTEFKLTEQMRVDFVANVSHEIRTPLTSIRGFTQILQSQKGKVDESLHPFLDKIVANTERMISLFNDLLNLSVIESRQYVTANENVELFEILKTVESNIKASYPERDIRFENSLKVEQIRGDHRLLEQVILNLCDNACKYSTDSVTITVSSSEGSDKMYLSVKDNGPGISKEHLPRIFERFYRVDASRESLRGTGLGLAIVKQIITKHKGKIWAESEGPGTGTKFMIELPKV